MNILRFAQTLMKISGILPTFGRNLSGRCLDMIKLILILISPIYVVISTLAFSIAHYDDLRALTTSLYISVGTAMAISVHCSLCFQSDNLQILLDEMELLVNESESMIRTEYFRFWKIIFHLVQARNHLKCLW